MAFGSKEGRRRTQQRRAQAATSRALKTNPTTVGIAAKNPSARRNTSQRVRDRIATKRTSRLFGGRGGSAAGSGAGAPRVPSTGGRGGRGTKGFTGGQLEGSLLGGGLGLGPPGGSAKAPTGTTSATMDSFSRELERKFSQRTRRGSRGR